MKITKSDEDSDKPPSQSVCVEESHSHKIADLFSPTTFTQLTLFSPESASPLSHELLQLVRNTRKKAIAIPEARERFRRTFFPGTTELKWNDWRWQLKNRIKDLSTLEQIVHLSGSERRAISRLNGHLPVGITPYYASLIDPDDYQHPLRKAVIMTEDEYVITEGEEVDPLGEENDSPLPGLVHRYPDRVLFLVTGFCPVHCRYCTRSRLVGNSEAAYRFQRHQWEEALSYIESHTEVRDVLLSGGDPLTLADEKLDWLLSRLRRIPHIEMLRIGTKVPVVLPQRITGRLVNMLRKYHPLWMSIHFTHPEELTPETGAACERLADAGIPLGSQTVLLKGINDEVETLTRLYHGLLKIRVRPYYLYQCDPIAGSSHFRTSVKKGLELISGLQGHTSGYAVPHYVIDAPGGGGKIPLLPEYVVNKKKDGILLRNYEGKIFRYPEVKQRRAQGT
jgi:lysine 2,3-aminomutase